MDPVLAQLQILYTSQDSQQRSKANAFLQSFQKTPEAWTTASQILAASDAPDEAKLFAGQTFRSKITYDLSDLSTQDRLSLRDSLLSALRTQTAAPKNVTRQIALSLADLLLQLPEWHNAVGDMIGALGRDATTASTLLEFLSVLAEESATNGRIDATNNDILTSENAQQVLALLSLYVSTPGIDDVLKGHVLYCLAAWLGSGGVPAETMAASPLFDFAFDALRSPPLFDDAVDCLCSLIHETQELQDNVNVIQKIVPRLVELGPMVQTVGEDEEQLRGLTKVLAEAGETYVLLMVQHPDTFLPIVQALSECSKTDELEIVQLTFSFWYRLSKTVQKAPETPAMQPYVEAFGLLVEIMFRHLQYPDDVTALTGQARDEFREFRHNSGDKLKDCCDVLGVNACLKRAYDLMTLELGKGSDAKWQAIEAPLFGLRSMGSEVDPKEDSILPAIMTMIPKLPNHPKIRYAAILVISRYTVWTNEHPEHIPFQMDYVAAGFGDADDEVWLASASALKYLCSDCSQHLVPYLPQLHTFLEGNGARLPVDDLLSITEGISCVIRVISPPAKAVEGLRFFCAPLLEQILRITNEAADKPQLKLIANALERLGIFLKECSELNAHIDDTCAQTALEGWRVIDQLLLKHGAVYFIAETACAVIRRSYDFFYEMLLPLAGDVIQRMATAYQASGLPSYLWITGKFASFAQGPGREALAQVVSTVFDIESKKTFEILPSRALTDNQDVIEDYLGLCLELINKLPDLVVLSPHLPATLASAASAFTLTHPNAVRVATDYVVDLLGHPCLAPTPEAGAPVHLAPHLRAALQQTGHALVAGLFNGIVMDFEDTASAITAFRLLAERFPNELMTWLPAAIERLPPKVISSQDLQHFVQEFNNAMRLGDTKEVRASFVKLDRVSRRSKQRQWAEERDAKRMGLPPLVAA